MGSEMCIRDSIRHGLQVLRTRGRRAGVAKGHGSFRDGVPLSAFHKGGTFSNLNGLSRRTRHFALTLALSFVRAHSLLKSTKHLVRSDGPLIWN